jgi:DNA helicase-2/ATP-dependent DNA helicase PcrA
MDSLNEAQRRAAEHPDGPLLVIAGAGSGKTNTLAHRVAHLVLEGADPHRILLLTFTRRAAAEMTRRATRIVASARQQAGASRGAGDIRWSGTFHAVANRLLRFHAQAVGLDPSFTVLDRSDAEDLMNLVRSDRGLSKKSRRFPRKGTCLSIYSRTVNAQTSLETTLEQGFPWCEEHAEDLRGLFRDFVAAKQSRNLLDYDDLLLYWYHLMQVPALAAEVGERFDHVLVDEYQDTNALQAEILRRLKPDGRGVTVVGDDAQSIYSFRAASVRNILDFPAQFESPATVVTLEQNYRSTQPILSAANAVISQSRERYAKQLFSLRESEQKPLLVSAEDELAQVDYVVERILANREAGVDLMRQAVLFRTAHHSDALEVELARRNIPFVKFGGLKFLEAAHVKDVLCVLRWVENPRDSVAGFRVLQLLPGVGPATARRALAEVESSGARLAALAEFAAPAAAREHWGPLCELLATLGDADTEWRGQLRLVRTFYEPLLEQIYDGAAQRLSDLHALEHISTEYPTRERFLTELTLDPPGASGDLAGDPLLDEDYLILSTIHSAKGQEWDNVFVLNVADGCIPSDMATGSPEQIEEERRLLYVAMTRARDQLHLVHPLRMYIRKQSRYGDRHVYAPRSRFLPDEILDSFESSNCGRSVERLVRNESAAVRVDVGAKLREMW